MKTILFSLITLIAGSAIASERSIELQIQYNNERFLNYSACLAGDNSRCECPILKEKARSIEASLEKLDVYVGKAVSRCLARARVLSLTVDGPGTADWASRARAEESCRKNTDAHVAQANEEVEPKRLALSEELTRVNGAQKAVSCN